jgi:hypothetical protein
MRKASISAKHSIAQLLGSHVKCRQHTHSETSELQGHPFLVRMKVDECSSGIAIAQMQSPYPYSHINRSVKATLGSHLPL